MHKSLYYMMQARLIYVCISLDFYFSQQTKYLMLLENGTSSQKSSKEKFRCTEKQNKHPIVQHAWRKRSWYYVRSMMSLHEGKIEGV